MLSKCKLPRHEYYNIAEKQNKYALCIPVINEGQKFITQLEEMEAANISSFVDIFICDAGSTDGSTEIKTMKKYNVRALIIRKSPGHMSDQLMLGYFYALKHGYKGTITMDGNGKDGIEGIFSFINALEKGYDLVQGSRYLKGGNAINTPKIRELAIRLIHVPIINLLSSFKYTDTTNGFRAHNIKVFKDSRIAPFRYGEFPTYSLIHYLTVRVPRLKYKVCEIPVTRIYPPSGKIPTKISPIKGNFDLLKILINLAFNRYNPKPESE